MSELKSVKKKLQRILAGICFLLTAALVAAGSQTNAHCVALYPNAVYTENFDSLVSSGTGSIPLPIGFSLAETGKGADNLYTANNGFSHLGDTYSYGNRDSVERALGAKTSGLITSIRFGGCFTNNTGLTIGSIAVRYTGEQWRAGTTGSDTLAFEYSTNARGLTDGIYVSHAQLNFESIVRNGGGSLDGNSMENRIAISSSILLNAAPGATIWVRWTDSNTLGSDDGLAIDDLFLTPALKAPEATISGRIKNSRGKGLSRVRVILTGGSSNLNLIAMTNAFGYYRFSGIPSGDIYNISVSSKSYIFLQSTLTLKLIDDINEADFIGRHRWE